MYKGVATHIANVKEKKCVVCASKFTPTGLCQKYCILCRRKVRIESNRSRVKKYQRTEKGKINREKADRTRAERVKREPWRRITRNVRWAIWKDIRQQKRNISWQKWVGYSLKDLLEHLEKQFDKNMNWDNYGTYWQIDHIKPISGFHYISPTDSSFKECWALENLRPLEARENARKGNRSINQERISYRLPAKKKLKR